MADASELLDEASEFEYQLESSEGALWTGSRLFIGVCLMAWSGLAFAYFYLRASDQLGNWDPGGVHPSRILGTLIAFGVVLGALLIAYGRYKLSRGLSFEFQVAGWLTVLIGVILAAFQIWQMARIRFFPAVGGYTSVYIGFAPLNAAMLLGGTYWLETKVARALRLRREIGVYVDLAHSDLPEARLFRANLEGCAAFWWFMAAMSILFWVLFYLL
jgi:heme/copper-type cytochrome/quinol oxidase subunit 3